MRLYHDVHDFGKLSGKALAAGNRAKPAASALPLTFFWIRDLHARSLKTKCHLHLPHGIPLLHDASHQFPYNWLSSSPFLQLPCPLANES